MAKLITGILGTCVLIAGCKGKAETPHSAPKPNPPAIVDVIVAATSPVNNTIEASGTIVANEYAELHPEISGRITYLDVPEGTQIAKGTLIARINDADLQAQLQKSKVQLDLYQKTEERDRKLLAINGINQADYDLALNNVNSTKADIDYIQAQIDKTIIRAPFNGIIGLRQVSIGAYVSPTNVIATIQQLDKIKVDFTLPEQYGYVVKKGATVDVVIDVAGNVHRKAQIIATEPQITATSRNVKVRALLEEGKGRPGAFAKVYINAGADAKSILVPTNAIIPNDKNNQVILVKDGKATFTDVRTGVREANNIEITDGINPGDTVVVTGVLFARPDATLKVRSVKTLARLAAEQQ
jgi:membrane fusion protein (multidrug efflux system)